MFYTRLFQRYAAALLALSIALLTGCTDTVLTETPPADSATEASATNENKMRHAHLLRTSDPGSGAKQILERYDDLSTSTEFVIGLSHTTLHTNQILERYGDLYMTQILERYKLELNRVLERYDGLKGVRIKRVYDDVFYGFAVHVDQAMLNRFLKHVELDDMISWIEPDINIPGSKIPKTRGNVENSQRLTKSIREIGGDKSWTVSGDGTGTVQGVDVFLIDTAVRHDELNLVETIDFTDASDEASDLTYEHGTHVAGTIAARDDDDGTVGVAPGARLHSLRVVDDRGTAQLSDVISAVEYATEQKRAHPERPMVVNISLGADIGTTEYNALDEAIQASIEAGVVYVIAAGNGGIDASTVTPAHVRPALTIGAAKKSANGVAPFSNHGPIVDLYAPGVDVGSLDWDSGAVLEMTGTSMAAPQAAGAAALLLSLQPELSPSMVASALKQHAKRKDQLRFLYVGDL